MKNKVRINQLYANYEASPRSIISEVSPSFISPALFRSLRDQDEYEHDETNMKSVFLFSEKRCSENTPALIKTVIEEVQYDNMDESNQGARMI
jgi:hypothetical protein